LKRRGFKPRRKCGRIPIGFTVAEKHDSSTSAAKACTEEKGFIAALKRRATQNHSFSANFLAAESVMGTASL
jgi:hypothetical protein